MNEETVLETTIQTDPPTEPATEPVQTETAPSDPGLVTEPSSDPETLPEEDPEELDGTEATIYEDFSGSENEEYTAATEAVNVVEVIQAVGSDIVHINLFGSFLICGTLIGLALFWKVYDTRS